MPIDALTLLTRHVRTKWRKLAHDASPSGRYQHKIDLEKTNSKLPVWLYLDGVFTRGPNNKIVFKQVAQLTVKEVFDAVDEICGPFGRFSKIYRIDLAVDLWRISVQQLANSGWLPRAQCSKFYRSREGASFYPSASRTRTIVFYDRLGKLRSKQHPDALGYTRLDVLTRVEVQLRGKGVPIRQLHQIREYADVDPLNGLVFLQLKPISEGLKPQQTLAAEQLQLMIVKEGLQSAVKRFGSSQTAFLLSKYFQPATAMPDIKAQMRTSIREWLKGIRRFPRLPNPMFDVRIASRR